MVKFLPARAHHPLRSARLRTSPETKAPYYEADDLAALLVDRRIKHGALVASSHGGQVGMEFTYRYPQVVSDLVLVGPGVSGFQYSEHFLMPEFGNQEAKDRVEAPVNDKYADSSRARRGKEQAARDRRIRSG